jgi:hypothetical protein
LYVKANSVFVLLLLISVREQSQQNCRGSEREYKKTIRKGERKKRLTVQKWRCFHLVGKTPIIHERLNAPIESRLHRTEVGKKYMLSDLIEKQFHSTISYSS